MRLRDQARQSEPRLSERSEMQPAASQRGDTRQTQDLVRPCRGLRQTLSETCRRGENAVWVRSGQIAPAGVQLHVTKQATGGGLINVHGMLAW